MDTLHLFRETEGRSLYAARDSAHALEMAVRDTGAEPEELDIVALADAMPLTLDDDGVKVTKTCAEWARDAPDDGGCIGGADY